MITAIDTNILLDLLLPDAPHASISKALLDLAYQQGALLVSEVVYAELASQFPGRESLDKFLKDTGIRLEPIRVEGLHAAAGAWKRYRQRRGHAMQCAECGRSYQPSCPKCGRVLRARQHILSDFLVGGHAVTQADVLLSRDRGFYRQYFPELKVLPARVSAP